jgi:endoglucanase
MKTLALLLALIATPALALPVDRCVNLGNALDAPREGEWGYTITTAHLDWIAAQGFDTVRLPVRFSQGYTNRIAPPLLARVTQVVEQAQARGLQVIIDVHHFEALMADPGRNGPVLVAIWQELSTHFAGYGAGVIFEIVNEPTENLGTEGAVALYNQIIPIIRAQNPNRWIIIGGGEWSSLEQMMRLGDPGPNVALTFHYYSPWDFTHQNAGWMTDPPPARSWGNSADRAQVLADMTLAGSRNPSVFLGEFGVSMETPPEQRANWTRAIRQAAAANGIGWCVWALSASFPIYDTVTNDWMPGMQSALME